MSTFVPLLFVVIGCSCLPPEPTVLIGHTEGVVSVAFSPDGASLASRSLDGTVRFWSRKTGRETAQVRKVRPEPGTLAFSLDGSKLLTNDSQIGAFEWELRKNMRREYRFRTQTAAEQASSFGCYSAGWFGWGCAYSPGGRTLAAGDTRMGGEGTLTFWDEATGEPTEFVKHDGAVTCVAYSRDGALLASGGSDRRINLWRTSPPSALAELKGRDSPRAHAGRVYSVVFTPNHRQLVSAGLEGTIKFWDLSSSSFREIGSLHCDKDGATSLAVHTDGRLLFSGHKSGTIRVWNVAEKKLIRRWQGHQGSLFSLSLSPDGKTLATGGEDKLIKLWSISSEIDAATVPTPPN